MSIVKLMGRLRDEFTAMPGLRLSASQAGRLCDADESSCEAALRGLVSAGFLIPQDDGIYARTQMPAPSYDAPADGMGQPAWRQIVCLVDFETDDGTALGPGSASALRYALTLAVGQRARVTAVHVVATLPQRMAFSGGEVNAILDEQQQFLARRAAEMRTAFMRQPMRELIDLRVAVGSTPEELLRVARDVKADLIVIGRGDRATMLSVPRLRAMLQGAACPVLFVHPAGQAAVA